MNNHCYSCGHLIRDLLFSIRGIKCYCLPECISDDRRKRLVEHQLGKENPTDPCNCMKCTEWRKELAKMKETIRKGNNKVFKIPAMNLTEWLSKRKGKDVRVCCGVDWSDKESFGMITTALYDKKSDQLMIVNVERIDSAPENHKQGI